MTATRGMAGIITTPAPSAPEGFFRGVTEVGRAPVVCSAPDSKNDFTPPHRKSRMKTAPTLRALRDLVLVAAASLAAASLWATGLPEPEQGELLDAPLWRSEIANGATEHAAEGWYRIVPRDGGIDVRNASTAAAETTDDDAMYFRLAGLHLQTGLRMMPRSAEMLRPVQVGADYELSFGRI